MSDWSQANAERVVAAIMIPRPLWVRWAMAVTVYLPGPLGRVYDRLERYWNERALQELRARKERPCPK